MSIKTRIEDFVGTTSDDTALQQWIEDACDLIIRVLPEDRLWNLAQEGTDSGSGLSIGSGRVVYAHVGNRGAHQISPAFRAAAQDTNSPFAASALTPVFWVANGKVFVQGATAGGTVSYVGLPTVDIAQTTIPNWDDSLTHLTVLYAAAQWALRSVLEETISDVSVSATPPSTITLAAEIAGTVTPGSSSPGSSTAGTASAGSVGSNWSAASLTFPDWDDQVGEFPNLPIKFNLEDVIGDASEDLLAELNTRLADDDVEFVQAVTLKIEQFFKQFKANLELHLAEFNTAMNKWQTEIQQDIRKNELAVQEAIAQSGDTTQASVATASNTTQSNIADGQMSTQSSVANAQQTTQANTATQEIAMRARVEKNNADIRKFAADVQSYQAEVNAEVQIAMANLDVDKTNVQRWTGMYQSLMQQFTSGLQAIMGPKQ